MRLNRLEAALMNNPIRAAMQRRFEAPRLRQMGGPMNGGAALEIGCGRGVGTGLILDTFGADSVDSFDLDPGMVARARGRVDTHRTRFWVGDTCAISAVDATYDAVFDFGVIHHVPDWRSTLAEIHRVLKPGGRLYAEEVLERVVVDPIVRRLLKHPVEDRFDTADFARALGEAGFEQVASKELWGLFAWFAARKPETT